MPNPSKPKAKNKVTIELWETAIREALQYVANYDKVRWRIVDICLSVCDVTYGGRRASSVFTIAKFSQEIGLDRKTLYEWIKVKTFVYDKLPKNIQEKAHKYNFQDFKAVRDNVEEDTPPEEVNRRFEEQINQHPEVKTFMKYNKVLKSLIYNVTRPLRMKAVPEEVILELIEKTNIILNLLRKEIELRKKFEGLRKDQE